MTTIIPTAQGAVRVSLRASATPSPRKRRRSVLHDGPDPIDIHVGSRLKLCRTLRGITQGVLAFAVGLTLQQIQKYEGGRNRISASMLYHLAEVLDIPVSFFFDGLEGARSPSPVPEGGGGKPETATLLEDYQRLSPELRKCLLKLVAAMAAGARQAAAKMPADRLGDP